MSTAAASPQIAFVERLLQVAAGNGATEIRLASGSLPVVKIDGQFRQIKGRVVAAADFEAILDAVVPHGADRAGFPLPAALGAGMGSLLELQGATVLAIQPGVAPPGHAAPPSGHAASPPGGRAVATGNQPPGQPNTFALELDAAHDDEAPADATGADAVDEVEMPKAAAGTVLIDKLLTAAVQNGVSDIHITAGIPPVFRIDGAMRQLATKVLTGDDTNGLMKSITPERCQAELAEKGGCDFGFAFKDLARFRVSVFKQRGSVAMVLRQIPNKLLTPEQLGVPEVCKKLVTRPRGLFLVTGPTGSGKSTTLAGLIDFINDTYDHHIITIEDPIEFYHYSKKSTVNQREIGTDVPSFSEALRRALRQDPDVILVGELRDLETIEAAISAAETGHVVFGTLHTTGAQGTVNRIIDAFPTNQQEQIRTQLSTAILGVLSQTLLPKIGGGRCAAYEVLVVDPAIGNLIRENKTFRINSAIQTGAKKGMRLLDDDLFRLWKEKKVAEEDVLMKAQNVDDLAKRIANAKQGIFDDPEQVARRAAKEMER